MKTRLLFTVLLATTILHAAEAPSPVALAPLPTGWTNMATNGGNGGPEALPGNCELGIDSQKSVPGKPVYSVLCANAVLPSYGGGRSTIQTAQYRGKRARVSAWIMASAVEGVKTPQYAGVVGEGGLWIGVGSQKNGMRMDRMQNRSIKGTTDWEYRDFVVDVPEDNRQMFIGFWMQGKGQIWVRDFNIEEVPATVPVNFLVTDTQRVVGPDLSLLTTTAPRANEMFLAPPAKWLAQGSAGFELCDIGVDVKMLNAGQRNLSIACGVPQSPVLRQAFEASPFWGKRVRFSVWLKVENHEPPATGAGRDGVGVFLANSSEQNQTLRADVAGTSGWQQRELVMDVPRNATWLIIGLHLSGRGQVWARDFKFEEVPR